MQLRNPQYGSFMWYMRQSWWGEGRMHWLGRAVWAGSMFWCWWAGAILLAFVMFCVPFMMRSIAWSEHASDVPRREQGIREANLHNKMTMDITGKCPTCGQDVK